MNHKSENAINKVNYVAFHLTVQNYHVESAGIRIKIGAVEASVIVHGGCKEWDISKFHDQKSYLKLY